MSIDIETYSSVDLRKSGAYAYTDAPDFEILLFGYAFDDEKVKCIDLAQGEMLSDDVLAALTDETVIKTAYNANFERTCISRYLKAELPVCEWRCSAVAASELGLPQTLEEVAEVIGLPVRKDASGKALIRYFCRPCKGTKANGGRERNLPQHAPEKWDQFKAYNITDVEVERAVRQKLSRFPLRDSEQQLWEYDQRITDRGVYIDAQFAKKAIELGRIFTERCVNALKTVTGLDNPNSVAQLKAWIGEQTGSIPESLDKDNVAALLETSSSVKVKTALRLHAAIAKTSNAKYDAMLGSVCHDGKIRGLLQFYGANRTGRWAGRIVQVQNLPQNHIEDLDFARGIVSAGDYDLLEMLYGNIPETLSQLIRTAFIPSPGRRFIVSDFSAIEARVIAYLAGESWRSKVFAEGGDIYCASASKMFGVPVVKHGVNGHLRQKGKIAELALGYGGSCGALTSMGALKMGLEEAELKPLVDTWRSSNPKIVQLWKAVENAALKAVRGCPERLPCGIGFQLSSGILFVSLPSGRKIAYVKPRIEKNRFGSDSITYLGMDQTKKRWTRLETFGGKLTENIVQAFARDCLAESIIRLEDKGFEVDFHVHDEAILDVEKGVSSAQEIADLMSEPIAWAPGLVLRAEAYETDYYKKD